jgi:hypothetical protein
MTLSKQFCIDLEDPAASLDVTAKKEIRIWDWKRTKVLRPKTSLFDALPDVGCIWKEVKQNVRVTESPPPPFETDITFSPFFISLCLSLVGPRTSK